MSRPDLHVIVISGDGDASAIGGNHLIHAARRNIGITTVVFNNNIYGMTGGQYSPTTPKNARATTAPFGNIDRNFDICELAGAAGATYTARSTVYHVKQLVKYIENGMKNEGFSLIEAISVCPTQFGRKNKRGTAVSMFDYLRDKAVTLDLSKKLSAEELQDKFIIGEFKNSPEPEYSREYEELINRVNNKLKGDSK
jgi:2-oxoglutarate ferredoxin oxidoreductase subunit beta